MTERAEGVCSARVPADALATLQIVNASGSLQLASSITINNDQTDDAYNSNIINRARANFTCARAPQSTNLGVLLGSAVLDDG